MFIDMCGPHGQRQTTMSKTTHTLINNSKKNVFHQPHTRMALDKFGNNINSKVKSFHPDSGNYNLVSITKLKPTKVQVQFKQYK